MHHILFVCLGNICRSPAAEGIFRHIVEEHGLSSSFVIDSAGLGGWHIGELPDRRMRKIGEKYGYTFTHHARQITGADFECFDLILGMDRQNIQALQHIALGRKQREKIRLMSDYLQRHRHETEIADPYYGKEADFHKVITLLEDACQGLFDEIIGENTSVL